MAPATRSTLAFKLLGAALLAAAAAYVALATPFGLAALSPEGRKGFIASIDAAVRSAGIFGPALFVLIYASLCLVVPATVPTAAGAFIFGKYLGFFYNIAGANLGAAAAFFAARYLLRDFAARFLSGRLAELDEKAERHGFAVIFYLRVLFFPFFPLNYAAGVTRIRYRDFALATALGIIPGSFLFSFFFGSIRDIVASYRGPADLLRFDVLFPALLFVFSLFIPKILSRVLPRP